MMRLIILLVLWGIGANVLASHIVIGVLAQSEKEDSFRQWLPMISYLDQSLGEHRFSLRALSAQEINAAVAGGQLHFVITQPSHYIELSLRNQATAIATLSRALGKQTVPDYAAVILSKRADGITTLDQLRGKSLAVVDKGSFAGYLMAARELRENGLDPEENLHVNELGGDAGKLLAALLRGQADAISLSANDYYALIERNKVRADSFGMINGRKFRDLLVSTRSYPQWPLAKTAEVSLDLAKRVSSVLMSMPANAPALKNAGISGWTVPLSYQTVLEYHEELLAQRGESLTGQLLQFWQRHSVWLMAASIIFVLALVMLAYMMVFNRRLKVSKVALEAQVRETRQAEMALEAEKNRAFVTLASITNAVISTDTRACIQFFNPVAAKLLHLDAECYGKPVSKYFTLLDENQEAVVSNPVELCLAQKQMVRNEHYVYLINRKARQHSVEMTVSPMMADTGEQLGTVLVIRDVTELRKMEQQLQHQAKYDPLTGLFNRRQFEVKLQLALDRHRQQAQESVLLYMDLDQFKLVNDTCGHMVGDELLKQLTARFKQVISKQDCFARLGGDEFAVLLENCDMDGACQVAERIRHVTELFRFVWAEKSFEVGVSIGIVPINQQLGGKREIMNAADVACYAAKDAGRNRVHIYSPDDKAIARRFGETHWIDAVKKALQEKRFRLECQAINALNATGAHCQHYEILVRMIDERGRIVKPMAFIPAAERYRQMPAVDRLVIDEALRILKENHADRPGEIRCFINLSGQTINDRGFLQYVMDRFYHYGVDARCIGFEITETTAIANLQKAKQVMAVLRDIGCCFALDDFGTGWSSFAYLKELPVDYIKIDGSFIRNAESDPIAMSIIEAIVKVGESMGTASIAEFIENQSILQRMRKMGVDYVQGYAVARPVLFSDALNGSKALEVV